MANKAKFVFEGKQIKTAKDLLDVIRTIKTKKNVRKFLLAFREQLIKDGTCKNKEEAKKRAIYNIGYITQFIENKKEASDILKRFGFKPTMESNPKSFKEIKLTKEQEKEMKKIENATKKALKHFKLDKKEAK